MKKNFKSRLKEGIGEALAEIIFSLLFIAVGVGVLALFGVGNDAEWLDGDLIILIGIGAVLIPTIVVCTIVHTIKKANKKAGQNIPQDSEK